MYRIVKAKSSKDKSFSNTMFCSQWECTKSLSTENVNELKGQFPSLKRTLLGKMPRIKMPSGVYFCCLQISFSCIQTLKNLAQQNFPWHLMPLLNFWQKRWQQLQNNNHCQMNSKEKFIHLKVSRVNSGLDFTFNFR